MFIAAFATACGSSSEPKPRATQVAIRQQPGGANAGSRLSPQPVVEIHDAGGALVTSSQAVVTATLASGAGSLTGTTSVAAVNGVATFTDLAVVGPAGSYSLQFSSPGLTPATSTPVTVTAPSISIDSAALNDSTVAGSNAATRVITIRSTGTAPVTGVTVNQITYGTGEPTGWINATVTSTTTFRLTLTFATSALPEGTYHATITVSPTGTTGSSSTIPVTMTVLPRVDLTFGAATEKTRLMDVGATFTPTFAAAVDGQTRSKTDVRFVSRAPSVVSVDASGQLRVVGPGQTWVVAQLLYAGDSIFVNVPASATGPVLRADLSTWAFRSGDTITVRFTLDPRGTAVAGATVAIGYEVENNMFGLISAIVPDQSPAPVLGTSTSRGVYKVSVASANALQAPVVMLQLRLLARVSGQSGWLTFTALDIVAPDGTDVRPQTTSTRYPVVIR